MNAATTDQNLSYATFEVLQYAVTQDGVDPADSSHETLGLSKTDRDFAIKQLIHKGLLRKTGRILRATAAAQSALEPYRVKRAVILAAGRGERLRPETDTTPKPMVHVHSRRLIETQLDALAAAGIRDITIVRGYKGELFDVLLETYPHIKFIDNPRWDSTGEIISASLVIDYLAGAYLIEGDLYIRNPAVLRPYEYRSSWCGKPGATHNDWYFSVDQKQKIHALAFGNTQGQHDYTYVGIEYWAPPEARQLKFDLQTVLQTPANQQGFIESIPFDPIYGTYNIYARRLLDGDVTEIDTHAELLALRDREHREPAFRP
ncbi:MAG: phosphocholine cytidylyltransferase family protein [Candidatus Saccharibacteria bacterium]